MIITRLRLANWRNFTEVDVALRERAFIIGPNASGKSNLLDAIRFLRDVSKREAGGLRTAVSSRGGVGPLRCLSARANSSVSIEVHLSPEVDAPADWVYRLAFTAERSGNRRVLIQEEVVDHRGVRILNRPDSEDRADSERLTATALEQINVNKEFRPIADFFDAVTYMHLVPQLVRHGSEIGGNRLENDPYGQGFLERIAGTHANTRRSRLKKIQDAIAGIVPQLREIDFDRDSRTGQPHLKARFENWRQHGAWQREDQFSDGTLRLIGLMWSLLDRKGILLLEEPEISLNRDIVIRLPVAIHRLSRTVRRRHEGRRRSESRQVVMTTHSSDMLSDSGIDGREVLYIEPEKEGSVLKILSDDPTMREALEAGVMPGEIAPFRSPSWQIPMDLGLRV